MRFIAWTFISALLVSGAARAEDKINFDEHIAPLFRQKCANCHNTDKKIGGLDLTSYTSAMLGGSSGEVIEPGSAADSYLFMLVNHETEPYMPPNQEKIEADSLTLIAKWIDQGALENASSKPRVTNKPKTDLALMSAPTGRPEGPPPMPGRLALEPVVHTERTTAVTALATNPWSPLVAVAGQKQVLLYDAKSLELLGVLPFPEGVPFVLKFSRNGQLLLAGGGRGAYSGKVVVWNIKTGERIITVGDELDAVLAADISADQSRIALGNSSRIVRIYSTATGEKLHEIKKHTDWVTAIEFSPDGVLLATGDRNGGLFVWEAHTAREYLNLKGHSDCITDVSWRIDSNILASASKDSNIRLWEMVDGRSVKNWGAHGGGAESVEFTQSGLLVTCGRDRVAKLWNQEGQQQRAFEAFGDYALCVTFCDETNQVIAGDWTGEIRVWNSADGKRIGQLPTNPPKLATRLKSSEEQLAAYQPEFKKAQNAHQSAASAWKQHQTNLETAKKSLADAETQLKSAQEALAQAKTELESRQKAVTRRQASVTETTKRVAELKEKLSQAEKSAAEQPESQERKTAVELAKANLATATVQLQSEQQQLQAETEAVQLAQKQLAITEQNVQSSTSARDTAKKTVETLTAQSAALQKNVTDSKTALDAATAKLRELQSAAERWKNEIALVDQLAELAELRRQHDELLAVAEISQNEFKQAQNELAKSQEKASAMEKQLATAQTEVTKAEQSVKPTETALAKLQGEVEQIEAALPPLKEARSKLDEAAKTGEDQEIAVVLDQLDKLIAAKTNGLEAKRNEMSEATKAVQQAKETLTAAQETVKTRQTELAASKTAMEDLAAKLSTYEQKAQSDKKAADGLAQRISEMETAINPPSEPAKS